MVDRDYRGEVGVVLFNHGQTDFHVNAGDRIAQVVLECICEAPLIETTDLDDTARSDRGYGSTGIQGATPVQQLEGNSDHVQGAPPDQPAMSNDGEEEGSVMGELPYTKPRTAEYAK